MRSDQGSRSTKYRYFVLRAPDQVVEVARLNGHGAASFYEPVTRTWINDPLLGVEIVNGDEWRPAEAHELPDGVEMPPVEDSGRGRRRKARRGRHANPAA